MAGIVNQTMQQGLTPDNIRSRFHIPPSMQDAYQRIVLAGMKVMFDPQTHKLMLDALDGPGDMPDKLGKGIASLMGLLWQQSNRTMPPQLMIPAGLELLAHAVDFLNKSGQQVSNQDFGDATQVFIQTMLEMFHLDPEKVAMLGSRSVPGSPNSTNLSQADAGADTGPDVTAGAMPGAASVGGQE